MVTSCIRPASGRCGARRRILLLLLSGLFVTAIAPLPGLAQIAVMGRAVAVHPHGAHIEEASQRFGIPAAWIIAVMQVESAGDMRAISTAGAMGLMQVMPGTAQGIADQLGWPGFEPRQAYWPYVNVAFGAFYVSQWLNHFGGSVFTALAAYNGGPGNAQVWRNWAPRDDDLMAALININETRVYVQAVWINYEAYQRLYP